jgi:glycosyltransferase involved in cell wall biosynthesis
MRIVHVLPALTKGGGERVAVELANHAVNAGNQVTLIAACPADPALLQNSMDPKVSVVYVSSSTVSKLGRYAVLIPWLWRHRSWLAEQDIIHCHLTYGAIFGTIVKTLRRGRQPRVLETCHFVGMPMSRVKRWFHARLSSHRDAFVLMAQDQYWTNFLARHPDLLFRFIPNGISMPDPACIDKTKRMDYRKELNVPKNCDFVIGTVGRLVQERKPWLYFPIFAEIARLLGPGAHFVIAGGGPELDRMSVLVAEHGLLGRVHLPGLVLDPRPTMLAMDLYITLNVGATPGVAAMEAALLGVPVLAVQLLPEYEREPTDWIWSSSDLSEVARQSITILRSPAAKFELLERQGSYVRSNHTTEVMGRAYQQLYRTMKYGELDQSGRSPH